VRVWILLSLSLTLAGQSPDCSVAPGFPQDGKARAFDTETLYEYMNGNSEGYFLYSFKKMNGVTCKKGGVTLIVDLSEFQSDELAYGMFTGNIDPRLPTEKIGAGGQVTPRKVIFVKGKYYAEIAAEPDGDHTVLLRAAAQAWDKKLAGSTAPPAALSWFPQAKLQPGSPRLVPQSVLGLRLLKRGYLALYEQGKAVVIPEASAQEATALMAKLKERFAGAEAAKIGDESFTAEDRYLGRMCFFRKGAYVGGFTNVPAGTDPVVLAATLIQAIK
jgi:hypothetical protein